MTIKTSLQNQAYQSIRQQIIYADLEPGKKVSEKNWKKRFLSVVLQYVKH